MLGKFPKESMDEVSKKPPWEFSYESADPCNDPLKQNWKKNCPKNVLRNFRWNLWSKSWLYSGGRTPEIMPGIFERVWSLRQPCYGVVWGIPEEMVGAIL